jgi:hypothetical protein
VISYSIRVGTICTVICASTKSSPQRRLPADSSFAALVRVIDKTVKQLYARFIGATPKVRAGLDRHAGVTKEELLARRQSWQLVITAFDVQAFP